MRINIHHFFEGTLTLANAALSTELSALQSTLSSKDSTISSLSTALSEVGDVSTAVSAAIDAEDTETAASISSILSAG